MYRYLNFKTIILLIDVQGHIFFADHITHHSVLRHRKWIGCSPTRLTLRAVTADPAWVALTGPVDGVAGAIVGAGANACTVFPKSATGTHCEQTEFSQLELEPISQNPENGRQIPGSYPAAHCQLKRSHMLILDGLIFTNT